MPDAVNTLRKKVIPTIMKAKFHGFDSQVILPNLLAPDPPMPTARIKLLAIAISVAVSGIGGEKKVLIRKSRIGAITITASGRRSFFKESSWS